MEKKLKILIKIQFIAFILNACSGDILFRTKPCEDGMIRQGNACVTATKAGVGDCKDPDLNNLKKGDSVTLCDGSLGEGKLLDCSADGEQDCVINTKFKAVNIDNLNGSDIKKGKIIAGVAGELRAFKQCRNYSNLSLFDSSYPPSNLGLATFLPTDVNTGTDQINIGGHGLNTNSRLQFTSTAILPSPLVASNVYYAIYVSSNWIQLASVPNGVPIDIISQGTGTHTAQDIVDAMGQSFDTIDDGNNALDFSPPNNPWNGNDYLCNASNFMNVTSTAAPLLPSGLTASSGTQPFTQIWQDQISGMYISNILSVAGGRSWSDAVRTCESLNGGTAGDGWRLPSQKELMQLYIHGIARVALAGGVMTGYFWSSSGVSSPSISRYAWNMHITYGHMKYDLRYTTTLSVLCVR